MGLLGYGRQHILYLGGLLQPVYQVTQKAASFECARTAGLTTGLVQVALLLGPRDPPDPMVLEAIVADRDAVWSFWQVGPCQ